MSARKDRDDADLSSFGANELNATFDTAKTKALETVGGLVSRKRDLPRGVAKKPSGKFRSVIKWGGKNRYIGTFDTPEQASAAFMSVRKDRDDADLSSFGANELNAAFDAAKVKAVETVGRQHAFETAEDGYI